MSDADWTVTKMPPDSPPMEWRPILGVDPGMRGGLAFLLADNGGLDCYDIPLCAGEVDIEGLCRLVNRHGPRAAFVERSGAFPQQGVASTFRYGVAVGMIRGVLTALRVPTHLVSATVWKKRFALDRDKEKSRALALRLWPGTGHFNRKLDHGRAEAALIARYGADVL